MTELFEAFQYSPGFLVFCTGILGLLVGSFLNVVILRLPLMMEQAWKAESRQILAPELEAAAQSASRLSLSRRTWRLQAPGNAPRWRVRGMRPAGVMATAPEAPITLSSPPSRCPRCGATIKPWQNIPVLSWLLLRGKCASCGCAISVQYPLVETIAGLVSAVCAIHFGYGPQLAGALALSWALIALTVIDLRTMLLPDNITLPLLWLGLLFAFGPVFADLPSAVVGAASGYLSLWLIYQLFKLITGKEGMGYGDFKLFAALGAWLGWQALPMIILLSSLVGAMVGIGLIVFNRHGREVPIPFGPYLAGAGWIALIWGPQIQAAYFGVSGIH